MVISVRPVDLLGLLQLQLDCVIYMKTLQPQGERQSESSIAAAAHCHVYTIAHAVIITACTCFLPWLRLNSYCSIYCNAFSHRNNLSVYVTVVCHCDAMSMSWNLITLGSTHTVLHCISNSSILKQEIHQEMR